MVLAYPLQTATHQKHPADLQSAQRAQDQPPTVRRGLVGATGLSDLVAPTWPT
jgi:hypothetical protein